ncbi:vacuolar protein-sorting-associated protein 4 [Fistulifera solaris]|uniref:vesicle-fusing ATPase n=1 Tax=Fistulifera solaris TaxID=1519565 RepID=A0A1Z5K5C8_FISSO|nr:vacuolar protein-sorting-associated protein 4 [Fistulifera solaris]|eukprot:GAX21419.1 vacuolar protein-sorting-associated protein 4 [Fistulifera solaris]
MDNSMITQGIEIVEKAIKADNAGEYEQALNYYRDALSRFTLGIKYEKNKARKDLITERAAGYMKRAEELKEYIQKQNELDQNSGGGGVAAKSGNDGKEDDEKKKLRGALAGAIVTEKPNVRWEDVAGLENAKESLKETVILPTKFPQLFTGKRKPFKGILLYGPPGTGKSYLAKAVATEADSTFFSVSSADLISKWQGESERLVRNLFEMARESENGRAIIFIDEVDSLCGSRSEGESDSLRRVKTEFLVQMDGVGKQDGQVLILGATNIPWELDAAIRRRFEKRVYIPLPEAEARTYMVQLHLGDTPNDLTEDDFQKLGEITEGASGSDIGVLVKEALMQPLRRCQQAKQFYVDEAGNYHPCDQYPSCSKCPPKLSSDPPNKDYTCRHCGAKRMTLWEVPPEKLVAPPVQRADFEKVMRNSVSTVSDDELQRFVEWTKLFGQDGA